LATQAAFFPLPLPFGDLLGPEAAPGADPTVTPQVSERVASYGIHPLPSRGALVSNDMIDRLRDQEGV
jgi:hypothetical protein